MTNEVSIKMEIMRNFVIKLSNKILYVNIKQYNMDISKDSFQDAVSEQLRKLNGCKENEISGTVNFLFH